jgi:CRISPR-associated endonuclease/helicase Cas3
LNTPNDLTFPALFQSLTGNVPFPWQHELFRRLSLGEFPEACDIPTGLGKTAIIPIWLIALANRSPRVPRRLIYVVNRRTVVDQATMEAERMRERLTKPGFDNPSPEIEQARVHLAQSLLGLAADPSSEPLAISTLRGQFADNREWSADPSRPAIIVGTVDMIGSRLLFGGYGIGFKTKPLHAGFLGQDAVLVHDEAHLETAFQRLIEAIRDEQTKEPAPMGEGVRLKLMALTATLRGVDALGSPSPDTIGLTRNDRSNSVVAARIYAKKALHLHEYDDEKKLADLLAERALSHKESGRAVLVFARTVEVVDKVVEKLRIAIRNEQQVEALTGTMRGKERDELIEKEGFLRFLPGAEAGNDTVYLVCTSAGECGINMSADHLICDLSTFESMAQRLGRVNRFGERDDTRIDVFHPKAFDEKDDFESRLRKTLDLLRSLRGDGSPDALSKLDRAERLAAFEPEPVFLPTSDILFDMWTLTSLREKLPGRPPLEPYLHGRPKVERPQTQVAWRDEVDFIVGTLAELYKPADLLEDYPLKPHELLRDRSDRVFKHIASLAAKHAESPAWLLNDDGSVERLTLEKLADKNKKDRIHGRTILLPPSVGGLERGLLNGSAVTANDVADDWGGKDEPRRVRLRGNVVTPIGMRLIRTIDTKPTTDEDEAQDEDQRFWRWFIRPRLADDDMSKSTRAPVEWRDHTKDVTRNAERIVRNLPLPETLKEAIILAAEFHDLGKRRRVWQLSIGNSDPRRCLAKSGSRMIPIELTPYRHEFGSLVDALHEPAIDDLDDDQKDLVLHLIMTHHGLGRPHIPADLAFDLELKEGVTADDISAIAAEVPRRFARLQKRYGRWGLAYLESLLRAADYEASANPSKTLDETL